jgi:hypothetical protein
MVDVSLAPLLVVGFDNWTEHVEIVNDIPILVRE